MKFHFTVLDFSGVKQGTAHGFEFTDFFTEYVFCDLKMIRKTFQTEILCCTAVDQFSGERFFIVCEMNSAAHAKIRIIHGKAPGNTDTVSYHDPEQPD